VRDTGHRRGERLACRRQEQGAAGVTLDAIAHEEPQLPRRQLSTLWIILVVGSSARGIGPRFGPRAHAVVQQALANIATAVFAQPVPKLVRVLRTEEDVVAFDADPRVDRTT